jgi:exosome complex exonuclease RRP6
MAKYTHADTHFLHYIYDNLRNALLDLAVSCSASPMAPDALVREVLSPSAEIALRVYAPDPYDAEGGTGFNGWGTPARRWNKAALGIDGFPSMRREVFRAVHVSRDRVAREQDESTG